MESRLVKIIPDHQISRDEESLTLDGLNVRFSVNHQVQGNVDLHLKLSGPREAREPFALLSGRRFSFALISNESQSQLEEEQAVERSADDDVPADPDGGPQTRLVEDATFTIDLGVDLDKSWTVSELESMIQRYVAGYIKEIKDRGGKRSIWKRLGSEQSMEKRLCDLGITPSTGVAVSLAGIDSENNNEGLLKRIGKLELEIKESKEENRRLKEAINVVGEENTKLKHAEILVSQMKTLLGTTTAEPSRLPTPSREHLDVFVSYDWENREIVGKMCEHLEARGYRCWVDQQNLRPGDNLNDAVESGLRRCKAVLACITRAYAKSRSCALEIARAYDLRKRRASGIPLIIPIFFNMEYLPTDAMPDMVLILSPLVSIRVRDEEVREWEGVAIRRLMDQLHRTIRDPEEERFEAEVDYLSSKLLKLAESSIDVVVIGKATSLKSMMINSLLGVDVMPSAASYSTETAVRIQTTTSPTSYFQYSGHGKRYDIDLGSEEGREHFHGMLDKRRDEVIEVYVSKDQLKQDSFISDAWRVFDTPDIKDTAFHAVEIRDRIRKADAVILVVDIISFFYLETKTLLHDRQLFDRPDVIIAVNKWDDWPERGEDPSKPERFKSNIRSCLSELSLFEGRTVKEINKAAFFVSSELICKVKQMKDERQGLTKEQDSLVEEFLNFEQAILSTARRNNEKKKQGRIGEAIERLKMSIESS